MNRELTFSNTDAISGNKCPYSFPYAREIVSSGSRYYALDHSGKKFVLLSSISGPLTGRPAGAGAFGEWTFGDMMFAHNKAYVNDAEKWGSVLPVQRIDGVLCRVVKVVRPSDVSTYWIGDKDRVLRRVEMRTGDGVVYHESYTHVKLNQPISRSVFHLSRKRDARQVAHF